MKSNITFLFHMNGARVYKVPFDCIDEGVTFAEMFGGHFFPNGIINLVYV